MLTFVKVSEFISAMLLQDKVDETRESRNLVADL